MTLIKKTKTVEPEAQPEQPVKNPPAGGLEESEAYYKMQLEKMMLQFKKTNKMIEDINSNLRTLIETDKEVHIKPDTETVPSTKGADGEDSVEKLKDKIEDQK
jgi:hypothetical protein